MKRILPLILLGSILLSGAASVPGATNQMPRMLPRTNAAAVPGRPQPGLPVGPKGTLPAPGVRTNGPGMAKTPGLAKSQLSTNTAPASPSFLDKVKQFPQSRAFLPAVLTLVGLLAVILVIRSLKRPKETAPLTTVTPLTAAARVRKASAGKIHACNVLRVGEDTRQLWQFGAHGGNFVLSREQLTPPGETIPQALVAKDWRTLYRRNLNIAWLPPEHVFLRVIQLPRSDLNETLSMVELQMEKLSPMPVNQVVWSIQVMPHPKGNLQTVIVMIVARNVVEEFLGRLEDQGYLADRLELPLLDQLQATPVHEDGAWIYPEAAGGKNNALVAWWYGGVLQNLDLVALPATNRAASVKEQLLQMAWAGEMEGWLTAPPRWHLVGNGTTGTDWEPALREGLEQQIETVAPLAPPELAARTASRAAQAEPLTNLLPAEFTTRYQQQFYDRLWMRGLGALAAVYIVGVAIYLIALAFASYRTSSVEAQVESLGSTYTNAMQLKARYQILKDRQELKFAALDCWNTTAKLLPDGPSLDSFNFSDGHKLVLSGTSPGDQIQQLLQFEGAMRKALTPDGSQLMFDPEKGDSLSTRTIGGSTVSWNFSLELKRTEVP
jgi:hypothetical protein